MLRLKIWSILLIPLMLGYANGTTVAYADTTILIMGEDHDRETVPRGHRIFTRVVNIISDVLNTEGYNVFDETAVTMETSEQGRKRRPDAELIDVARGITQPPIKAHRYGLLIQWKLRIMIHLINI